MKKLICITFLAALIWSCGKDEKTEPAPQPTQNNNPPALIQDSRFYGSWLLDSVRHDSTLIINGINNLFLGSTPPVGDSIYFSSNDFKCYMYVGPNNYFENSNLFGNWSTPYQDSLFFHMFSAPQIHVGVGYLIDSNVLTIKVLNSIDPPPLNDFWYYHKSQ